MKRHDFLPPHWMAVFRRKPGSPDVAIELLRDDQLKVELDMSAPGCDDPEVLSKAQALAERTCGITDVLQPFETDAETWESEGEEWRGTDNGDNK